MGWRLAITTCPWAFLEAGPTGSSAQGYTHSSSSPSISARYGCNLVVTQRRSNRSFGFFSNLGCDAFAQENQPITALRHVFVQAQQHMVAERNGGHRRQQAYITPNITAQAPYSFHHNSPSHTGNVHPHLAAAHLPSQPHLYTYTAPAALGSTGTVAHLVASQGSARHTVQHASYPPSIVHQVPVSMGHRVLPSPTMHHSQFQAQFAHQAYISASPASTVYTGYPLSPTKVNQYPYL